MKNKLAKLFSRIGDFIFYSKDDEVKDYKEYIRSFKFGFKLLLLITLLIIPPLFCLSIGSLPYKIFEKTPLYIKPLKITHIWAADSIDSIRGEDLREKDIAISFDLKSGKKLIVKIDRDAKGEKEKEEIRERMNTEFSLTYANKEMLEEIEKPLGYEKDITVIWGGLNLFGNIVNGILVTLIVIFCLALYFPIIKAIIKLFKSRKKKG